MPNRGHSNLWKENITKTHCELLQLLRRQRLAITCPGVERSCTCLTDPGQAEEREAEPLGNLMGPFSLSEVVLSQQMPGAFFMSRNREATEVYSLGLTETVLTSSPGPGDPLNLSFRQ